MTIDADEIRTTLTMRRDETRARVAELAKKPELGEAQGFGKRIGDGTVEAISRLTDIGVGRSLEESLERTERALAKLDDGTYGICDRCGALIPEERLEARPWTSLCIACASARSPASRNSTST